ncbi:MAG: ABC transporter ATP-binding protein [Clostridiales bacterium]|jgi:spermidine/putrescine transport system ATP-binding protein|nr:ABC transporter ATP-binding protein [Clostridiales bacterium]
MQDKIRQNNLEQPKGKKMDRKDIIIEIKSITKRYGNVTAVEDLNLKIRKGEFVTLLGPSGCGKTTLLRMIAGFESSTEGNIYLEGVDVTHIPPNKRNINTVFQKYALFPHLNVYNNIAFGLKLKRIETAGVKPVKLTKTQIDQKVNYGLRMVGLEGYGNRDINTLSGGQQQRVAIARALVLEPKVLLLDEPLGALDLKMRKEMQLELKKMHRNLGITFLYVTHDQEEALTMSDTVVVMRDGEIQQIGTPKKIYDEPSNAFVADFIGESNILSGEMVADYKVKVLDRVLSCSDKGFGKDEKVDLVIRPEDIILEHVDKGGLIGQVVDSIFKGDYYEMRVMVDGYEFSVQGIEGNPIGSQVSLFIRPNAIHIMKKLRTTNKYEVKVSDDNGIILFDEYFECDASGFEHGDIVQAEFDFESITLTDYESEGTVGGNVATSLYKGKYYQVQVYTDDDNDIFLNTTDDWDIGDRVGINISRECIKLTPLQKVEDNPEEKIEEQDLLISKDDN